MSTRRYVLAYSVGSTLGLVVGALAGGPVVDHLIARRNQRKAAGK